MIYIDIPCDFLINVIKCFENPKQIGDRILFCNAIVFAIFSFK